MTTQWSTQEDCQVDRPPQTVILMPFRKYVGTSRSCPSKRLRSDLSNDPRFSTGSPWKPNSSCIALADSAFAISRSEAVLAVLTLEGFSTVTELVLIAVDFSVVFRMG